MANTKFKPTAGYIFIQPLEKEVKTASGIYLPDNAGEKPQTGKVIAVGGTIYSEGHEVTAPAKIGDTVLYKKWGGNEVKIDGSEYIFVKFDDVLAVQEPMTLKDLAKEVERQMKSK